MTLGEEIAFYAWVSTFANFLRTSLSTYLVEGERGEPTLCKGGFVQSIRHYRLQTTQARPRPSLPVQTLAAVLLSVPLFEQL